MSTLLISTLIIVGAFYLVLLRPVLKQQQRQRRDIADLQVGDRVLTQAGFLATVTDIYIPEQGLVEIILDLGGGVKVTAVPDAIRQRLSPAVEAIDQQPQPAKEGEA